MILIPLEASFSTDLAALTAASCDDKGSNKEIPLVYGQALYQSYIHKLREACQALVPLVPSLINYVKELHYTLTKLARVSSIHAGNLHKVNLITFDFIRHRISFFLTIQLILPIIFPFHNVAIVY